MKIFKVLAFLLIAGASSIGAAHAQLLITPLHSVMEGRDRSSTIILVNTSENTNTYRLEWQQFVQVDELGGYAPVEEMEKYNVVLPEGTRFLKDFAVFTPRQITLGPNEKQTVRIAVRRPADLADGEHKSHLKFRVIASQEASSGDDPSVTEGHVRLGARVHASFSIPIVYRSGEYDINVDIQRPRFEANQKTGLLNIIVPLIRSGTHGAIGQLDAYFKPVGGQEARVGTLANVNLFAELTQREMTMVTDLEGLSPGSLRLVYSKVEGRANDNVVLDELIVPVVN